jgi:daunorubicin C-13 ketoreductase
VDLTGRTVVVTGASSGIGRAAAVQFARRGASVVLVGRDQARLDAAFSLVRAEAGKKEPVTYRADFTRLDDVHGLVDHLKQRYERIDVLANNAGGLARRHSVTADGFEATIQTNHLAGFLLSNLLREQLRNGRIINTSSGVHAMGALDPADLRGEHKTGLWRAYANSKQANVLFAGEAARRWPDILSTSYHPGFVRSRFGSILGINRIVLPLWFVKTPEEGADTMLWLASTPKAQLTNGGYYYQRKEQRAARPASDPERAAQLWDASLAAVGLT